MRIRSIASTLLVAPLLFALAPRADEITFHPSDDSKLSKKFTIKAEMELGDVTLDVNGQDLTGELPSDVSLGFEVLAEVVDHYIKVEGGKPLELVRQLVQFSGSYHAMEESDSTGDLDLPGSNKVRFKWNEDKSRYDVSAADGSPAPDELEYLGADMDLLSFLPRGSVSQGDQWKVDGKQLATALIPGVDLEHIPDLETMIDDEDDEETRQGLKLIQREFLPQLGKFRDQCKATCDYIGQREVDGRKLAAIAIKLDVVGSMDLAGVVRMAMKEGAGLEEADFKIEDASLKLTVKGEGELLWDIAAGHAHGFDWTAKLECVAKLEMSVTAEGEEVAVEGAAELTGKSRWTMELE